MRFNWAKPSLSRDFALLSAAIVFMLLLVSGWVTYSTYEKHRVNLIGEMQKEALRIEVTLATEIGNAEYVLMAVGRQIALNQDRSLTAIGQTLRAFNNSDYIYTNFSWVNPAGEILVSSNKGILEKPVSIADREYLEKVDSDPWKMKIGNPVEGRISGRWIVPVAMGITDNTGKFIGSIVISMDIDTLKNYLSRLSIRDGVRFAVVTRNLHVLTQGPGETAFAENYFTSQKLLSINLEEKPDDLISGHFNLWSKEPYVYYYVSPRYPYTILIGYDADLGNGTMRTMLWSRLVQIVLIALFFVLFLWLVRSSTITPILDLAETVANISRGNHPVRFPKNGPVEITRLRDEIQRLSEYIAETRRIEAELRNKMFSLKQSRDRAEIAARSKSEFVAYLCQELRLPVSHIIGFSQVMKDQMYGPMENRKYRQYSTDIYHAGQELLDQLQEMNTLSRIEAGTASLLKRPLKLHDQVLKIIRALPDALQDRHIPVNAQVAEELPAIICDEFRLQQLLTGLALYTAAFARDESVIRIEACLLSEGREKQMVALSFCSKDHPPPAPDQLLQSIRLDSHTFPPADIVNDSTRLRAILIQMTTELLQIPITSQRHEGALLTTVFFPVVRGE